MEAAGIGGPMLGIVPIPGLLAAGIGAPFSSGWTAGPGSTFSLAIPDIPPFGAPTAAEFGWALGIGLAGAVVAAAIRHLAVQLRARRASDGAADTSRRTRSRRTGDRVPGGLGQGLVAGALLGAGRASAADPGRLGLDGRRARPLVACKALAYVLSLSSFRGGPVFPGMFIGARASRSRTSPVCR